jgi:hypothetical protein
MADNEKPSELSLDETKAEPHASPSRDNVEPTEMTSWDGAGNPIKHVFANDESGHLSEGTGGSTDEATKDAQDPSHVLGKDASPGLKDAGSG